MKTLKPDFVEFVPEDLEAGVLYVSMIYRTAVHLCACGCGEKVVTPLSPRDWKLTFDGKSVTLYPSIGNWSFTCRSHYFIRQNQIVDVPDSGYEEDNIPASKEPLTKKKSKMKWWKIWADD